MKKRNGFTLIQLVVSVCIATSVLTVGLTKVKDIKEVGDVVSTNVKAAIESVDINSITISAAENTRTASDLSYYSVYVQDMFYNHPEYSQDGLKDIVSAVDAYLTDDLCFTGNGLVSSGCTRTDAWHNPYHIAFHQYNGMAAVLIWSAGSDGVSNSYLNRLTPSISEDDIGVCIVSQGDRVIVQN